MENSQSGAGSSPKPKKSLVWIERGLYALGLVLIAIFAGQWYLHHRSQQLTEPTGRVLSELEPSERIPLEPGAAAGCNVLILTMDTTRADHIGCYGHRGVQTPTIDGLARQGVLFAKAFTASPSTLPGHSSILTGLYPYHHGARANGSFRLGPDNVTLAEILQANGYATAAFVSAYVLDSRFGLDQGFSLYDDDLSKGVKYAEHMFRERPAQYTNDAALEWFQSLGDSKFFVWIHYFDPHAPYLPPEPLRTQYADRPYDGEIAYTDAEIGRLLSGLDKLGVLKNTLIVLAGDHGEGLGEHGEATHSLLVYDATLRTPLIFCLPKRGPLGKVVERQVSNVDIAPTILDLAGIKTDVRFDGSSLIRGPQAHDDTIYAETISTLVLHGWSPLFCVRQQDAKYIHAPRPELYDLKKDPKELNNLLDERPEQVALLSRKLEEHIGSDLFGADALAQMVTMDQETADKLADLGYVGTRRQTDIDPQAAAQFDPKDMVQHWERVEAATNLQAMGKFREALKELEACSKLVPNDVWVLQLLTSAYREMGDLDRADETAQRILALQPNDPGVHMSLGSNALARGQYREAEEQFNQALALDPNFAAVYVALGNLHSRTEGIEKGLEYYDRAIELDPGTTGPAAYNAIGTDYLSRMELDQARDAFDKALEIDPLNGDAHNGLARILIEEGKMEEAQKELEVALRFLPNDRRVLGTLAALNNKKKQYDEAVTLARRALEINENDAQALNGLGSALRNLGDLAGARQAFEKVLERNPRYVPCIINLAQVYLAERREEKAAELYERALAINPRQPMALFNLGTYKVSRGQTAEALEYYRRAIEADPDYAMAHLHLGMLLMMQGRADEALAHLERSLELDPDQPERERVLGIVETLRSRGAVTTQPQAPTAASGPS
jgi:tetratricopeptide (TPR) repeat protein/arylsulfatase A-like enzyme